MNRQAFRAWLVLFSILLPLPAHSSDSPSVTDAFHPPDLTNTCQLVLVIAADWKATEARLRCFARSDADTPWKEVFASTPVMIGRNGLAWGIGLHGKSPSGTELGKREHDGRAPAGAFALTEVFGYATASGARITHFPYQALTPSVEGVDDPSSRYYNRVVDASGLADKDWKSSEIMRRGKGLYRWGVVVGHNPQAQPGFGSCIFLHIWDGMGVATSGCTAMPAQFVQDLARWLDQKQRPALIQLPADEYRRLKPVWRLP